MKDTSYYKTVCKDGRRFFTKIKDSNIDLRSFVFQTYLSKNLTDSFNICKPIKITTNGSEWHLRYEHLPEIEAYIDDSVVRRLGEYTAKLHNFCAEHVDKINLPTKSRVIAMGHWEEIKSSPLKDEAFKQRVELIKKLDLYDVSHLLIPVHRDLKLRNILFDGKTFNLIDFDFAAIDDISIELGSFIADMFHEYRKLDMIKHFIKGYKSNSTLDINWSTVMNNYLIYMCCNTFPFYMKDTISDRDFKSLVKERNDKLSLITLFKKSIDEIIQG